MIFLMFFSGKFEYLHQGHCGGGSWVGPNTNKESIYGCRDECAGRIDVGYFAYKTGSICACYTKNGGCNYDGHHMDHTSYEILDSG